MKLTKQVLLHIFEVFFFTILITMVSLKIDSPNTIWGHIERVVFCYGIYQFPTYLYFSNKMGSWKDMYIALIRNYKNANLYLDTRDERVLSIINKNLDYQLSDDVFNNNDIISEYRELRELMNNGDKNCIQIKINQYEMQIENTSLHWRYSIFLSLLKQ